MALHFTSVTGRRLLQSAVVSTSSLPFHRFIPSSTFPEPSSRLLSSAAAAAVEHTKPRTGRRRILETKDPIVLTERAAERIKEILKSKEQNGEIPIGIRLGTKKRGCNGLSYTLNYAFERPAKDTEMESHGVKIFIEPMALFNVVGTTMDWEETELSSEFTFNNPNSKGECGCGESFTV